jgi:hypothetical protein
MEGGLHGKYLAANIFRLPKPPLVNELACQRESLLRIQGLLLGCACGHVLLSSGMGKILYSERGNLNEVAGKIIFS